MFLINKLFLLLFFFPISRISTIIEKASLSENNLVIKEIPYYSNYDGRELIILTMNKIRNNLVENKNSLKDEEIIKMLEILKQKVEVVNIEMNKMEIVFNDRKKTKFDIELLSSQERDFILKLLNYKGIQLSIKNDFDVIKTWIIKTIGVVAGISFITNIIKEMITTKVEEKSAENLLNSSDNILSQVENMFSKFKDEEKTETTSDNKINLIEKYIINKNDSEKIAAEIIKEYNKQLKEKTEIILEEKEKINLDNVENILKPPYELKNYLEGKGTKKNKIQEIKQKKILNYLENMPKEELIKKIIDFKKKNLSIDNYTQHLPELNKEIFQNIKNKIISSDTHEKIQFYIFGGQGGSGKTDVARAITNEIFFADLYQTFIEEDYEKKKSFKETIYYSYRGSDFAATKYVGTGTEAFRKFQKLVINDLKEGKKVQVIIDEADVLLRNRKGPNRSKDQEAQTDFLQFLDQIEKSDGLYYKYKNQFILIMTTNLNNYGEMDEPITRRGFKVAFTPLPTLDNLHKLFQDILDEKINNNANSSEETHIYKNIRKYIGFNKENFKNVYEAISLEHKKMYKRAKIEDLEEKNKRNYSEITRKEIDKMQKMDINNIDLQNKEIVNFMEEKVSQCGATRISKIIGGLSHFLANEILNKLFYNENYKSLNINRENINAEDLALLYKKREKKENPLLKSENSQQLYEWISNFFKETKNLKKLEEIIIDYIGKL